MKLQTLVLGLVLASLTSLEAKAVDISASADTQDGAKMIGVIGKDHQDCVTRFAKVIDTLNQSGKIIVTRFECEEEGQASHTARAYFF